MRMSTSDSLCFAKAFAKRRGSVSSTILYKFVKAIEVIELYQIILKIIISSVLLSSTTFTAKSTGVGWPGVIWELCTFYIGSQQTCLGYVKLRHCISHATLKFAQITFITKYFCAQSVAGREFGVFLRF